MNNARQTPGVSGRNKRRWADLENDGGPNAEHHVTGQKRQRVSRACDICRSRKDRCDGARPVCSTCTALCRPCSYKSNPKRRGLPTGYLRTLESLWGVVFCKISGSEQAVRTLLRSANLPSHTEDVSKEGEPSNTFLSAWKNSSVLKEVEKLLSIPKQPEEDPGGMNPGYAGSNSPQEIEGDGVLPPGSLEWRIPGDIGRVDENTLSDTFPSQRAQTTAGPLPRRQTRDCGTQSDLPRDDPDTLELRLPPNTRRLFDIYFSYTHCWFPILEKHDILRTAFSYDEQAVRVSGFTPGSGDHAAMWAILTLASIQQSSSTWDSGSTGSRNTQPDINSLYTTARRLIPPENGHYEIGHVQALLVLAMVKIGQQGMSTAWVLIGHAIRIASSLGLDRPFAADNSPATADKSFHGRSKHVFLGCFILESLVAAEMDWAPLLRNEDVSRVGQLDEDGLEEWHPWEDQAGLLREAQSRDFFVRGPSHAMSTFNRLVSLVSILNDFCCCTRGKSLSLSKSEEFKHRLQHWISILPENCRMELQGAASTLDAPHLLVLRATYETVVAAIQIRSQKLLNNQTSIPRESMLCVAGSLKRLAQSLQSYLDNYSFSAASPLFAILLRMATYNPRCSDGGSLSSVLDPDLRLKLQTVGSQLALVWETGAAVSDTGVFTGQMATHSAPSVAEVNDYSSRPVDPTQVIGVQTPLPTQSLHYGVPTHNPNERSRGTGVMGDTVTPLDSVNSIPRMGPLPNLDSSVPLHLQTPTASLTATRNSSDASGQPSSDVVGPSMSTTNNFSSSLHPSNPQYPQIYNGSNMNTGVFGNFDNYGPQRWTGIPPDLDALFDELASLEGSDKTETQPIFMRNLGFAPNSGVSDLYSRPGHLEPFLLPQTQQQPVQETDRPPG